MNVEPEKMLSILDGIGRERELTADARAMVLAVVTILWRDKKPGDLRDITSVMREVEGPFKDAHEFQLRRRARAALTWLSRRGKVRYVPRRGWVPV